MLCFRLLPFLTISKPKFMSRFLAFCYNCIYKEHITKTTITIYVYKVDGLAAHWSSGFACECNIILLVLESMSCSINLIQQRPGNHTRAAIATRPHCCSLSLPLATALMHELGGEGVLLADAVRRARSQLRLQRLQLKKRWWWGWWRGGGLLLLLLLLALQ